MKTAIAQDDGRGQIRKARLEWIAQTLGRRLRFPFRSVKVVK